ncbi:MAG: septum formation inhibitor Maf [Gammaproteobacteria bacterium]|nr:MAG: septum formation inhibitor Maf [Gammaproteobacteria bacterium]
MSMQPDIYLASTSPRRHELLAQIGVSFGVLRVDIDEQHLPGEAPLDYVTRLALSKARAGKTLLEEGDYCPVLGADTTVVADGTIMGKPRDRDDALAMLLRLSGRTHQVISAVALAGAHEAVRVSTSNVTFRTLTAAECQAYWETGEPQDKAGGYAIQGCAALFVERLEGSYSGVMGLPLYETAELFKEFKINIL